MQAETRIIWLKIASGAVIAFGPIFLLSTILPLSTPLAFLTDLVFWPIDGGEGLAASSTRLYLAISGGVLTGWGILLWMITTQLYPREPKLARTLILTSVGVWFIVDSLGSIIAGAPVNVLLNLVFLDLFLIPLLWPAPSATEAKTEPGLEAGS
ncbi:MAG: hypothetical protein ACR2QJ_14755 [Geminicoccaceae bacterium]